jgi:hypothetical protein
VDSSIWDEPDYVVKVFLTMLALKDSDHIVRLNAYQIGQRSRKTELEVLDALKILSSPDTRRVEPQEFDGRRIQSVEDGWLILNGQKYREMVSKERVKARNRRAQEAWRQRQKAKNVDKPAKGEIEYLRAEQNGASEAELDHIVTQHLPPE